MDLIKKVEAAEFSQRLRGYDPDEVDAFHAELVREIAQLQHALDEAIDRSASGSSRQADQTAAPRDARLHDPEGAIQRMLAVAQRTADEAVREAKLEAARAIAEAENRADKLNAEADEARTRIVTEAAAEARRVAEATRQPLVEEIAGLEDRRDDLIADVDALDRHAAGERDRLEASVLALTELLDDPAAFRVSAGPELQADDAVTVPDVDEELGGIGGGRAITDEEDQPFVPRDDRQLLPEDDDELLESETADEPSDLSSAPEPAPLDDPISDHEPPPPRSVFDEPADADITDLASARNEVIREADEPLPEPEPFDPTPPLTLAREPDDGAPPAEDGSSFEPEDVGPPTEAVLIDELLGEEPPRNDRFLDELRRATEDDFETSEESDAAIAAFFDQDEEESSGKSKSRRKT